MTCLLNCEQKKSFESNVEKMRKNCAKKIGFAPTQKTLLGYPQKLFWGEAPSYIYICMYNVQLIDQKDINGSVYKY